MTFPIRKSSHSQFNLILDRQCFSILALSGYEALNTAYYFEIEILSPFIDAEQYLATEAQLQFMNSGNKTFEPARQLTGIITAIECLGAYADQQLCYRITLSSRLALLENFSGTRVILGQTPLLIAKNLLSQINYHDIQLDTGYVQQHYSAKPYTLQLPQESAAAFLQRLLARVGLIYWIGSENGKEKIHFADNNKGFVDCGLTPISYNTATGFALNPGLYQFQASAKVGYQQIHVREYNAGRPTQKIQATQPVASATPKPITDTFNYYGGGSLDTATAQHEARLRAERQVVEAQSYRVKGNLPSLGIGQIIQLNSSLLPPNYQGEYVITAIRHHASQPSGQQGQGLEMHYHQELSLLPKHITYRSALLDHPPMPALLQAKIESVGSYALLNEEGHYQLRLLSDIATTAHMQALPPLRRASCYTGEAPSGWHMPLAEGTEVLLSAQNGDPDRLVILATVPYAETLSPVIAANKHQYRFVSQAQHQLLFDEFEHKHKVRLSTQNDDNQLCLDATTDVASASLISKQGSVLVQAGKSIRLESGEDTLECGENDRIHTIVNQCETRTDQGDLQYQAHTTHMLQARQNLKLYADRNGYINSAAELSMHVQGGASYLIIGKQAEFETQGNIKFSSNQNITILAKSDGSLSCMQNNAGIQMDAEGNIHLYGQVQLNAINEVVYKGVIRYGEVY
ncbi:type VI secretion system tip protein TssI/VgrG [soil metagenome]